MHPDIHYAAQSGAQTASNSCKGSEHNETKYKKNLKEKQKKYVRNTVKLQQNYKRNTAELQNKYKRNTAELQKKYNKRKVRPWSTTQLRVELKHNETKYKYQDFSPLPKNKFINC